jgi:Fic family protein
MMTLRLLSHLDSLPTITAWYLTDLGEALGKQELFTKQSPQKLKVLREHALIESAVSSNRIEGVTVDQSRIATVVFGKSKLRDRNEEEVRGYRAALEVIHEDAYGLPVCELNISQFHRKIMGQVGDAGEYRKQVIDIIQNYPDGRRRVRFKTVEAKKIRAAMREMIVSWNNCVLERRVPHLVALAAMNLDFLCIHPFRDGNGRVSRLLMLLQCYHLGYEVGRYISLERLIEENKDRYYETLEESSHRWHEGKHDAWPYINFVLFILKSAYKEFEERVGQIASPRGAKAEIVLNAIRSRSGEFRLADIERDCPGVGREWIRVLLVELRKSGQARVDGRGPGARWRYVGSRY